MNSSLKTDISHLLSQQKKDISFLQKKQRKIKRDLLSTQKFNKILDSKIEDTWKWIYYDRKRPIDKSLNFRDQREMIKMIEQLDKQEKDGKFNKTYIDMNNDFKNIREKLYETNKTLANHNITWGKNAIYK